MDRFLKRTTSLPYETQQPIYQMAQTPVQVTCSNKHTASPSWSHRPQPHLSMCSPPAPASSKTVSLTQSQGPTGSIQVTSYLQSQKAQFAQHFLSQIQDQEKIASPPYYLGGSVTGRAASSVTHPITTSSQQEVATYTLQQPPLVSRINNSQFQEKKLEKALIALESPMHHQNQSLPKNLQYYQQQQQQQLQSQSQQQNLHHSDLIKSITTSAKQSEQLHSTFPPSPLFTSFPATSTSSSSQTTKFTFPLPQQTPATTSKFRPIKHIPFTPQSIEQKSPNPLTTSKLNPTTSVKQTCMENLCACIEIIGTPSRQCAVDSSETIGSKQILNKDQIPPIPSTSPQKQQQQPELQTNTNSIQILKNLQQITQSNTNDQVPHFNYKDILQQSKIHMYASQTINKEDSVKYLISDQIQSQPQYEKQKQPNQYPLSTSNRFQPTYAASTCIDDKQSIKKDKPLTIQQSLSSQHDQHQRLSLQYPIQLPQYTSPYSSSVTPDQLYQQANHIVHHRLSLNTPVSFLETPNNLIPTPSVKKVEVSSKQHLQQQQHHHSTSLKFNLIQETNPIMLSSKSISQTDAQIPLTYPISQSDDLLKSSQIQAIKPQKAMNTTPIIPAIRLDSLNEEKNKTSSLNSTSEPRLTSSLTFQEEQSNLFKQATAIATARLRLITEGFEQPQEPQQHHSSPLKAQQQRNSIKQTESIQNLLQLMRNNSQSILPYHPDQQPQQQHLQPTPLITNQQIGQSPLLQTNSSEIKSQTLQSINRLLPEFAYQHNSANSSIPISQQPQNESKNLSQQFALKYLQTTQSPLPSPAKYPIDNLSESQTNLEHNQYFNYPSNQGLITDPQYSRFKSRMSTSTQEQEINYSKKPYESIASKLFEVPSEESNPFNPSFEVTRTDDPQQTQSINLSTKFPVSNILSLTTSTDPDYNHNHLMKQPDQQLGLNEIKNTLSHVRYNPNFCETKTPEKQKETIPSSAQKQYEKIHDNNENDSEPASASRNLRKNLFKLNSSIIESKESLIKNLSPQKLYPHHKSLFLNEPNDHFLIEKSIGIQQNNGSNLNNQPDVKPIDESCTYEQQPKNEQQSAIDKRNLLDSSINSLSSFFPSEVEISPFPVASSNVPIIKEVVSLLDTNFMNTQQQIHETIPCIKQKEHHNQQKFENNGKKKYSQSDFYMLRRLGEGKHSEVFLAQDKATGFLFAVKQIYKSEVIDELFDDQLCKEIRLQMLAKHANILSLYGFVEDENCFYLLMEYAPDGEFSKYLASYPEGRFSEPEAAYYLNQLASALSYLHAHNIVHRDLKPANLLLSNGILKLADFGYCTIVNPNLMRTTFCGTLDYLSPKMISGEGYGKEVDVWSFGVLAYEFLQGVAPFYDNSKDDTLVKIQEGKFEFILPISQEAQDFISALLTTDAKNALSIRQIVNHPWLIKNAEIFQAENQTRTPIVSDLFNSSS